MANPSVNATNSCGMDKQIWNNIAEKDCFHRNKKVMLWIQAVTGEEDIDVDEMMAMLKDGYLLWKLLLKIDPEICVKMKKRKFPNRLKHTKLDFPAREQVELFIKGSKILGMKETDCFTVQALYNGEMPHLVCSHLYALCAVAQKLDTFKGPYVEGSFKHSDVSRREFTEDQLAKSRNIVPKMMQGKDMPDSGESADSAGIVKQVKSMQSWKHNTTESTFATGGSIKIDRGESGDAAGIVKQTKSMQKWKHNTTESTFATSASIKVDRGNKLDSAGIIKTAGNEGYRASTEATQMSKGSKKVNTNTRDFVGITGKAQ